MLKQVHQPPSHKQTINFHSTTKKRRKEKIMPFIFSKNNLEGPLFSKFLKKNN
jgi:hypothetical protein